VGILTCKTLAKPPRLPLNVCMKLLIVASADSHIERNWEGTLTHDKWQRGSALDFKPTRWMPRSSVQRRGGENGLI
jgi:hypothetical protein